MLVLLLFSVFNIAVSISPIKGIVEEIGGKYFSYQVVYPRSANPHLYEPRPADMLKVKKADLFIYAGRAEPGGTKLCKMARKCVSLESLINVDKKADPHVWLAPGFVKEIADSLAGLLANIRPQLRDTFKNNARKLSFFIDSLLAVSKTKGKSVILMHGAFKPLFEELGFDVLVISKEPGIEPGARRIKEVSDSLKQKNVVFGVCEEARPCNAVIILSKRYNFKVITLDPLYDVNFTTFLREAILKINNAANNSN